MTTIELDSELQPIKRVSELANIVNLILIPLIILLAVLVLTDTTGAFRLWISLIVFTFGAGSGVVQFLRLPTQRWQLGLIVAFSAALDILVAQGLLGIHNLNNAAGVFVILGLTCIRPLQVRPNNGEFRE